jgi:hypothetical protein
VEKKERGGGEPHEMGLMTREDGGVAPIFPNGRSLLLNLLFTAFLRD